MIAVVGFDILDSDSGLRSPYDCLDDLCFSIVRVLRLICFLLECAQPF